MRWFQDAEVELGGFALDSPELFRRHGVLNPGEDACKLGRDGLERFHGHPLGVVAGRPLQHPAGIIDFAQQETFGVPAADAGVVCGAELLLP